MPTNKSSIKPGLAAITVATQVIGLASFAFMIFDLFISVDVLVDQAAGDRQVLADLLAETFSSYRPYIGIGVVGAIAAWLLILKGKFWAPWYLKTSRVLAWIWLPLFPAGTVLGVLILSARSFALEAQRTT